MADPSPRPDDLAAVRAEGRRLLAETTKGPWHQMAAAAWSGTNEDPNLVADCPLYADAIAIVWLRNHADALLADPAPEGLSEEERRHFDRVRAKYALWERAEAQAQADPDDEKAGDAADDLLSSIGDDWVLALPHFFAALDRISASTEEGTNG